MNDRNLSPAPSEKVWLSAYTDGTTECFEIRTVDQENTNTPYAVIWHGEYPMGQAMADFLYVDLGFLNDQLTQIQSWMERISKRDRNSASFPSLHTPIQYWLDKSPLLVTLGASIERLRLSYQRGNPLTAADLGRQAACIQQLQPRLFAVAQALFDTDQQADLIQKYTELQHSDNQTYPPLRYGAVELQEVWCGGQPFSTYASNQRPVASDHLSRPQRFFTTEVVSSESIEDIINFLLVRYMQNHLQMKLCKYCGRYFATKRAYKTDYCDRPIQGSTKTCREAGSLRLYEKRRSEDPAMREFKRSYKAHNARIRYGLMTREEFSNWSKEAREKRNLCLSGQLSLQDFVSWLDSDKL